MQTLSLATVMKAFHDNCPAGCTPLESVIAEETLIPQDELPQELRGVQYNAREYEMACPSCGQQFRLILGLFPGVSMTDPDAIGQIMLGSKEDRSGLWSKLRDWWDSLS